MDNNVVVYTDEYTVIIQSEGIQGPPGPMGPTYELPDTVLNTSSYIDGGTFN